MLSVNYNSLGNYGNNYHSPFVFTIGEVLSTTCLRRIMFIQIIDEVTKRKEITRGSLLDFVLLVWAIGSLS